MTYDEVLWTKFLVGLKEEALDSSSGPGLAVRLAAFEKRGAALTPDPWWPT